MLVVLAAGRSAQDDSLSPTIGYRRWSTLILDIRLLLLLLLLLAFVTVTVITVDVFVGGGGGGGRQGCSI